MRLCLHPDQQPNMSTSSVRLSTTQTNILYINIYSFFFSGPAPLWLREEERGDMWKFVLEAINYEVPIIQKGMSFVVTLPTDPVKISGRIDLLHGRVSSQVAQHEPDKLSTRQQRLVLGPRRSSVPLEDLFEIEDGLVVVDDRPYRGGKLDVEARVPFLT